jgi:hypothetical protein
MFHQQESPMDPKAVAIALVSAAAAWKLWSAWKRQKHVALLRGKSESFVPANARGGRPVHNRQRVELAPCENALLRMSTLMQGSFRPFIVITLHGEVHAEAIESALVCVQALQPVLRCRLVRPDAGKGLC